MTDVTVEPTTLDDMTEEQWAGLIEQTEIPYNYQYLESAYEHEFQWHVDAMDGDYPE